jgi:hypothetical protein
MAARKHKRIRMTENEDPTLHEKVLDHAREQNIDRYVEQMTARQQRAGSDKDAMPNLLAAIRAPKRGSRKLNRAR